MRRRDAPRIRDAHERRRAPSLHIVADANADSLRGRIPGRWNRRSVKKQKGLICKAFRGADEAISDHRNERCADDERRDRRGARVEIPRRGRLRRALRGVQKRLMVSRGNALYRCTRRWRARAGDRGLTGALSLNPWSKMNRRRMCSTRERQRVTRASLGIGVPCKKSTTIKIVSALSSGCIVRSYAERAVDGVVRFD